MSYKDSLVAAGARVLAFQEFGDWQGSWVALVEYQGQRGWIHGWFGSCDHCDAFQAEFGWGAEEQDDYERHLKDFGMVYIRTMMTTDKILQYFIADSDWDSEAEAAMFWIRETEQTYRSVQ